jgi:hypothetical protein
MRENLRSAAHARASLEDGSVLPHGFCGLYEATASAAGGVAGVILGVRPAHYRWMSRGVKPHSPPPGGLQPETIMPHQQHLSCIEACHSCAVACNHCAASCLKEQDVKMMSRCIALDMDCAAICQIAAAAMSRGSEHAKAICALCADICQTCGDECAKHSMDHCQQCAKACLQCAKSCREMAAAA